ncbi:hypothetical protein ONZ51_g5440 [Trametes cubensis]|uniref:Cytochrome P450 n=1 Tax=Trametes cubensis TaxID=1111947 RepID=A0AAD7XC42_9APHY|nr:hypothetical protein ONZ51_g5440 [Trametes cubensis]
MLELSRTFLLVTSLICVAVWLGYIAKKRRRLPPRPPSTASSGEPWKVYAQWAASLGPLVRVTSVGNMVITLNTFEAASDLLEKRGHFASRPPWPMADLLGRQKNVAFQYYGDRLRRCRKALHASLSPTAIASQWSDLLDYYSRELLVRYMESPTSAYADSLGIVESLILQLAYGHAPGPDNVKVSRDSMEDSVVGLQPGTWWVNSIPALRYIPEWFPGAGFKRWANKARKAFVATIEKAFFDVKEEVHLGKAPPSFVRASLERSDGTPDEDDIIMSCAGSLFSAGSDTIIATYRNFLLYMMLHPDIQERAFQELVSVIGNDRLPTAEDQPALPFIDCLIQEVHRIGAVVPLMPHSNWKDDEYLGYHIPKDSWIMGNGWAMLHDSQQYANPQEFNPDRFAAKDGRPVPRDPRTIAFGFGRRLCPGMHFANAFLFLAITRTLAAFEICPTIENGQVVAPSMTGYKTGLVWMPSEFKCTMKPRAKAHAMIGLDD